MPDEHEGTASAHDFEPRARIFDSTTGEVKPVRRDAITGLDEFSEAWQHNTDMGVAPLE